MSETMRVSIGVPAETTDDHLRYAAQMGCAGVVIQAPASVPGDRLWEVADLVRLREWVERYGLRLESLSVPHSFWMRTRLGEPGRDEELEHLRATLRALGEAGVPMLGYNFRADPLYRTS